MVVGGDLLSGRGSKVGWQGGPLRSHHGQGTLARSRYLQWQGGTCMHTWHVDLRLAFTIDGAADGPRWAHYSGAHGGEHWRRPSGPLKARFDASQRARRGSGTCGGRRADQVLRWGPAVAGQVTLLATWAVSLEIPHFPWGGAVCTVAKSGTALNRGRETARELASKLRRHCAHHPKGSESAWSIESPGTIGPIWRMLLFLEIVRKCHHIARDVLRRVLSHECIAQPKPQCRTTRTGEPGTLVLLNVVNYNNTHKPYQE
jgi:hypothetical protein